MSRSKEDRAKALKWWDSLFNPIPGIIFSTNKGNYKIINRWLLHDTLDFTNIETGEGKSCSVEYFNDMQQIGNIEIVEL